MPPQIYIIKKIIKNRNFIYRTKITAQDTNYLKLIVKQIMYSKTEQYAVIKKQDIKYLSQIYYNLIISNCFSIFLTNLK